MVPGGNTLSASVIYFLGSTVLPPTMYILDTNRSVPKALRNADGHRRHQNCPTLSGLSLSDWCGPRCFSCLLDMTTRWRKQHPNDRWSLHAFLSAEAIGQPF